MLGGGEGRVHIQAFGHSAEKIQSYQVCDILLAQYLGSVYVALSVLLQHNNMT